MLFMGDRIRQLVRTYEEVVHRFKRYRDAKRLYENLQSSDEIKQFYKIEYINGVTSVELHPSIFSEKGTVEDLDLDVQFQLGKKKLVAPLPFDRILALGHLLPLLRADLTESEIRKSCETSMDPEQAEWALSLISSLKEKGLLTSAKLPANFFTQLPPRPRVTFMGHSSLLFQSTRASVLADPLLRLKLRLPAFGMDVARLKLDAICISHTHWDHCDLQTLMWFDKNTLILIPEVKQPTVFNPPVVETLHLLGFKNIREVRLWEPIEIQDITVVPVPFHGEQDEPGAVIDHFTYVLKTEGLTVYGGVDSYRDTFGDMKPVLERIRDQYQPDLAFLPVSKMVYRYEWGGVNAFCRYLDTTMVDKDFQYTASGEDAAEWVSVLKPQLTAPYATFNFPRWSTPAQVSVFESALSHLGLQNTLFPFRPFDALESSDFQPGTSRELRRRALVRWFKFGATMSRYHQRLLTNRIYRFISWRIRERIETEHH
jgi:L-ascorbate metabolism protein UlaG (beta-lactamase superfamily)